MLAQLERRCGHMLAHADRCPRRHRGHQRSDQWPKLSDLPDEERRGVEQDSNILGEKEEEIVKMANIAIRLIETEGTAIAFAEVFKQVRKTWSP